MSKKDIKTIINTIKENTKRIEELRLSFSSPIQDYSKNCHWWNENYWLIEQVIEHSEVEEIKEFASLLLENYDKELKKANELLMLKQSRVKHHEMCVNSCSEK